MRLLATIKEQDIRPDAPVIDSSAFTRREAVRAVVLNGQGQVALLNVSNKGYHKLPGGGIDEGEDMQGALERELLEEVGCRAEIVMEIGKILEYWDEERQVQTSYCYLTKQISKQQQSNFTEEEQAHGFRVMWVEDIDEAIAILEADNPQDYGGRHIKPRDLLFLKAAKSLAEKVTYKYAP